MSSSPRLIRLSEDPGCGRQWPELSGSTSVEHNGLRAVMDHRNSRASSTQYDPVHSSQSPWPEHRPALAPLSEYQLPAISQGEPLMPLMTPPTGSSSGTGTDIGPGPGPGTDSGTGTGPGPASTPIPIPLPRSNFSGQFTGPSTPVFGFGQVPHSGRPDTGLPMLNALDGQDMSTGQRQRMHPHHALLPPPNHIANGNMFGELGYMARDLALQPVPTPPSLTLGTNSQPGGSNLPSFRPQSTNNSFVQDRNSFLTNTLLPHDTTTSPRRQTHSHYTSSSTTPRASRSDPHFAQNTPLHGLPVRTGSPFIDRVRLLHLRNRRNMSSPGSSQSGQSQSNMLASREEQWQRSLQLVRGATLKTVASRAALQSLQTVEVADLPEGQRMCDICYNEYGVETPEGINEAPLRLPKCQHVFGDHCLKTWLRDADNCPYCRDKLPGESRPSPELVRELVNSARATGIAGPDDDPQEIFRMLATAMARGEQPRSWHSRQASLAERRSPPADTSENHRRTRQRLTVELPPGQPINSGPPLPNLPRGGWDNIHRPAAGESPVVWGSRLTGLPDFPEAILSSSPPETRPFAPQPYLPPTAEYQAASQAASQAVYQVMSQVAMQSASQTASQTVPGPSSRSHTRGTVLGQAGAASRPGTVNLETLEYSARQDLANHSHWPETVANGVRSTAQRGRVLTPTGLSSGATADESYVRGSINQAFGHNRNRPWQ